MELDDAIEVLRRLRDGSHPTEEGLLPPRSPSQHPTVVRALYTVLGALASRPRARSNSGSRPPNYGKPWTAQDDERLLERFDAGDDVRSSAETLGRTVGSVHARLVLLGRLEPGPRDRIRGAPTIAAAASEAASGEG
jgi:hypothetical protein